jgi:hypothetical protein
MEARTAEATEAREAERIFCVPSVASAWSSVAVAVEQDGLVETAEAAPEDEKQCRTVTSVDSPSQAPECEFLSQPEQVVTSTSPPLAHDAAESTKSTLRELAELRAENAALRERLAIDAAQSKVTMEEPISVSSSAVVEACAANDETSVPQTLPATTATDAAAGAMPSVGSERTVARPRGAPWTSEEAALLRRLVKRIIRKGTNDRDVLWAQVSAEMGNGRSARECKLQYARDYRAHKAKIADVPQAELTGDAILSTSATGFYRGSDAGVLSSAFGTSQSERRLPRLQPLSEPVFQSGMALSQSAM